MSFASLRRRLFASAYDRMSTRGETVLAPLRREVVSAARGSVLEIGVGTGANLPFYAPDVELTAFEPNPWMAAQLERKAARFGRRVQIDVAGGATLPYVDAQFDAVVATFVLCSVADQPAVLAEIRRVLRGGGQFYFLEHVAAPTAGVRAWQRRLNPLQRFFADGCELDRDTESAIRNAGFASTQVQVLELHDLPQLTRHMIAGVARA
jgi:ubiquinone/menaquinone biosynthesis C-methylase UbiE